MYKPNEMQPNIAFYLFFFNLVMKKKTYAFQPSVPAPPWFSLLFCVCARCPDLFIDNFSAYAKFSVR